MLAELDGESVGLVWAEQCGFVAPALDGASADVECLGDHVGPGALLELVEEGLGREAVVGALLASLAAFHQSRLAASVS